GGRHRPFLLAPLESARPRHQGMLRLRCRQRNRLKSRAFSLDPSVAHRFGISVITAAGLGLPRMLSNVASINSCAPALYKSAINPTVFCAAPLNSHRQLLKELVLKAAGRSPL